MAQLRRIVLMRGSTEVVLPDPDPAMGIDQVRELYASEYPELINAKVTYPDNESGERTFTFGQKEAPAYSPATSNSVTFTPSVGKKG